MFKDLVVQNSHKRGLQTSPYLQNTNCPPTDKFSHEKNL